MSKSEYVAGLDIGSGRITCVVGGPDPEGIGMRALAGSIVPCRGVKAGAVLNVAETARAIRQAVEKAEEAAGVEVRGVYLGVRGEHLRSFNNHGAYTIARSDREITAEDVHAVLSNAKAVPISRDQEILHVIPQSYSLDRQKGVPDPVGMEGSILETDVHIVTASASILNNLMKSVAEAGFEVIEPVYSVLALGEFLVSPEERELGSLLVDFGGQTVSIAVFGEGGIKFTQELPIGADFITRDLAVGLRTSIPSAEKLKIEHGVAHPKLSNGHNGEISFIGVDGRSPKQVKSSEMLTIVLPRVEEILTLVGDTVQNSGYGDLTVGGGAILTGGGALLRGIPEAVEQVLQLSARLGLPHEGLIAGPQELMEATYSTALALLAYPRSTTWSGANVDRRADPRWMRKIRTFLKDLF
ncbi:MAG TPA: cell division protein FtsA [Elusimicrobiota bacterium]|jgi:cell division protein FtsA|nr:cell division protein FtsA [Elusimicrobiota bacterium]